MGGSLPSRHVRSSPPPPTLPLVGEESRDPVPADRQPRRDRAADHPHGAAAGRAHGRGLFRSGRRFAPCRRGRRGGADRPAAGARQLPERRRRSWLRPARAGAEAIHPGYGFLSENAEFAEAVIAAGLIWVGPPPAAIRAMGLKDAAKRLMAEAGVATTPGYLGDDQSPAVLAREAARDRLAGADQGGRRRRRQGHAPGRPRRTTSPLRSTPPAARPPLRSATSGCCWRRYVTRPRHIEVQVFGDTQGHVVHLFERDCSLQRRHQKVIEEAPAPGMDAADARGASAPPPSAPPRRWTTSAPERSSSSPTRPRACGPTGSGSWR